ncbi:MAG: DM13 domain-containing protein [Gammaproteobacteria bacterium AqS3]|nr:DM13 domain-containing protein [Gammaproteobacteria bacterium AqS3]
MHRSVSITLGLLLGTALGGVAGAGGMLIAYPFLFPPEPVNQPAPEGLSVLVRTQLREGSPGQDMVHWGRGGLNVYPQGAGSVLLEFAEDFEVGPGPNFWIYLNRTAGIETEADFLADAGRMRLAKLKSFQGAQVYPAPLEAFAQARAVTIWCESFGEYIASADLPQAEPER